MLFPHYKVLIFDCADEKALRRCEESVQIQNLDNVDCAVASWSPKGIGKALDRLRPVAGDVVIFIESTDWLFNERTLSQLHESYLRYDLLFTSGFYVHHHSGRVGGGCEPPPRLLVSRSYQKRRWRCPGLKSCKAEILEAIRLDELDPRALESSLTYPMLELAGPRIHFFRNVQVVQGTPREREWMIPKRLRKYPLL